MSVQCHTQPDPLLTAESQPERLRIPLQGDRSWLGEMLRLVELDDKADRLQEEINGRQLWSPDKTDEASIRLQI